MSTHDTPRQHDLRGFPRGWFRVSDSRSLRSGHVKCVRYFGQDIVLFRTQGGEVAAVDPHCPHLGAHLGAGGKVVGEHLECPFHGWRFDTRGALAEVPKQERIPKACVRSWPVAEDGGFIFVYHGLDGDGPREIPKLFDFESLLDPKLKHRCQTVTKIRASLYETVENLFDRSHFEFAHAAQFHSAGPVEMVESEDALRVHIELVSKWRRSRVDLDAVVLGAGCTVVTTTDFFSSRTLVGLGTPLDSNSIEVVHLIATPGLPIPGAGYLMNRISRFILKASIQQDIDIWENRSRSQNPMLTKDDHPILAFRRWYSRHCPPLEATPTGSVERA